MKVLNLSKLSVEQLQWLYGQALLTKGEFDQELEHRGLPPLTVIWLRRQADSQAKVA